MGTGKWKFVMHAEPIEEHDNRLSCLQVSIFGPATQQSTLSVIANRLHIHELCHNFMASDASPLLVD